MEAGGGRASPPPPPGGGGGGGGPPPGGGGGGGGGGGAMSLKNIKVFGLRREVRRIKERKRVDHIDNCL